MPSPMLKDRNNQTPFGLVSCEHGSMILPLNDYEQLPNNQVALGVGLKVLLDGIYDEQNMPIMMAILNYQRKKRGDGVVMLDGGANIGCFTVSFARAMQDWGSVLAFEAQERLFYALCGNIALNNAMNAQAFNCALDCSDGYVNCPFPDYRMPGNYGAIRVDSGAGLKVTSKRIDSLRLERLDFLKIDVEGMELAVLNGALETIKRCKPLIMAEHIHAKVDALEPFFKSIGYSTAAGPIDMYAAYGENEIIEALNKSKVPQ